MPKQIKPTQKMVDIIVDQLSRANAKHYINWKCKEALPEMNITPQEFEVNYQEALRQSQS